MIYCFDKDLFNDYLKEEMKITRLNGNGILYDRELHLFTDFNGTLMDINEEVIFPRTGIEQLNDMLDDIVCQGGIPIVSCEENEMVYSWPNYYQDKKNSQILKGRDLLDSDNVLKIMAFYGNEVFIKTKEKNFSGVISTRLLLDKDCAFYKTLMYHLDDDFILSKKVNVLEDEYGKKEYRCFVIDNEIYNISRYTDSVFHQIDDEVLKEALKIVESLKDVFPSCYVVDLMVYELDGCCFVDVVEFNPISVSGLYLYNSCLKKSDDLLHRDIKKIADEFLYMIDKCTMDGKVFTSGSNLYNVDNSFANHLKSVCLTGDFVSFLLLDLELNEEDYARHDSILDFTNMFSLDGSFLVSSEEELTGSEKKSNLSLDESSFVLRKKKS